MLVMTSIEHIPQGDQTNISNNLQHVICPKTTIVAVSQQVEIFFIREIYINAKQQPYQCIYISNKGFCAGITEPNGTYNDKDNNMWQNEDDYAVVERYGEKYH